jgi:hypothetical protein
MTAFGAIGRAALLDAGMGFGEYTYIYVKAYHDKLSPLPGEVDFFTGEAINERIQRGLTAMLERQLAAARTGDQASAETVALEAEVAAMRADRGRVPWRGELPHAVQQSFVAHEERLSEAFCPAIRELELLQNRRRGIVIEGK